MLTYYGEMRRLRYASMAWIRLYEAAHAMCNQSVPPTEYQIRALEEAVRQLDLRPELSVGIESAKGGKIVEEGDAELEFPISDKVRAVLEAPGTDDYVEVARPDKSNQDASLRDALKTLDEIGHRVKSLHSSLQDIEKETESLWRLADRMFLLLEPEVE